MTSIEFKDVHKSFGKNDILKGINLKIESGEFLVLVGPSGCGKSTLLRSLAGLEQINSGEILVNGKCINNVEPQHRQISMVFQNYALYPHMSVFENISFAMRLQKMPTEEIKRRVNEISELLQISYLLDRKPKQLSGGQRQRVALGRAIARHTPVILFDEPLSNLDANLRNQMRIEIKRLHQKLGNTMIYVTHDQMEATTMGDRIAVMKEGCIEQLGTPTEIYHQPKNIFIASFIGSPEMNFLGGEVLRKLSQTEVQGSEKVLGARPEAIKIFEDELKEDEINLGTMHVELNENLGGQQMLHGHIDQQPVHILVDSMKSFPRGQALKIKIARSKLHIFDKNSGLNTGL